MAEAVAGSSAFPAPLTRAGLARAIALLVPAALLAGAFWSQYFGGLYPCEMCWWQRYAHMAALAPAAVAFTAPAWSPRSRVLVMLAALAIAISGAIGVYHAGVELKIFEGFTTCTSTVHAASAADMLKQILKAPIVRCDEVQWSFLGISMAGWNALISLSGAALVSFLTLTGSKR